MKRGKDLRIGTIELDNQEVEVYRYRSDNPLFGQSLFGVLMINEQMLDGMSEDASELVFTHELSHHNRNSIWKGLVFGSILWFAIGLVIVGICLFYLAMGTPFETLIVEGGAGIILISTFLVVMRIEETIADYEALKALGEDTFLSAYDEIFSRSSPTISSKIQRMVLYSTPEQTLLLHEILESVRRE
jgi:Zn-dependent protease with chaperone function